MRIILVWPIKGKTPKPFPGCSAQKLGQNLVIYNSQGERVASFPLKTISRWKTIDRDTGQLSEAG